MSTQLTHDQETAVTNRGGNLLVSAAAGSGKTKVLVDRLLSYVMDANDPANLDDFLIITYTKAAASELRTKIADKLNERIAEFPENRHLQRQLQRLYLTQISTVHGFCSVIVKEFAYKLGISADFRVADEQECQELRENVLRELLETKYSQYDATFIAFADSQGYGRNDNALNAIIQKVYDTSRCQVDSKGWLQKCLQTPDEIPSEDKPERDPFTILIDELHTFLTEQITVLNGLLEKLSFYPEYRKAVDILRGELGMLQTLAEENTWDGIRKINPNFVTLNWPRKNKPAPELEEIVKSSRDICKKELKKYLASFVMSSDEIADDYQICRLAASGLVDIVESFTKSYQEAKQKRRILDFSDLESYALDLLLGKSRALPTPHAVEIGMRFREVMVDEYQDSNEVQDSIFKALTNERHNCFMVGDMKQSIYQFRLADPEIFSKRRMHSAPAEDALLGKERMVYLRENFRSGDEILSAVNHVFNICMNQIVGDITYNESEQLKAGISDRPQLPDPAVELHVLRSNAEGNVPEAAYVAARIRKMLDEKTMVRDGDALRPVKPEDIVILLRSPGPIAEVYQKALEAKGIRCAYDNGTDLLQTPEVSTFRSLLQVIENPRQDIPLLTVLTSPLFGFSADDLAQIRSYRKGDLYDCLQRSDLPKAEQFLSVLRSLREQASMQPLSVLMERCLNLTRIDTIYGAMPGGKARQDNLHMFFQMACEFEKTAIRYPDQFLKHLDHLQSSGTKSAGSSTTGCVTIMSVHKSKGLEFPVVFLSNLSRQFNQDDLRGNVLCHKKIGIGLSVIDSKNRIRYPSLSKQAIKVKKAAESLSEELRVLYVAMTRARDRLVMTQTLSNPESKLSSLGMRLCAGEKSLLSMQANTPGDWILMAAMLRPEAGELHNAGVKPETEPNCPFPWQIHLINDTDESCILQPDLPKANMDTPIFDDGLAELLQFRYAHETATGMPSKQTATGLRANARNDEVHSLASEPFPTECHITKLHSQERTGTDIGNIYHHAMQFLRFEKCVDYEGILTEISELSKRGFLTSEQASLISPQAFIPFFQSEIGSRIQQGTEYIREFKFSILDDGEKYGEGLQGEQVLLQGVVDLALIDDEGITIVDFKTDQVTEDTVASAISRHRHQLSVYTEAMAKIFEKPVRESLLYFFRLGKFYSPDQIIDS